MVTVSVRSGHLKGIKDRLLDAIHLALVDALQILPSDRKQRILEYSPNNWDFHEDEFIVIEITMFAGRSPETKRRLFDGLAGAVSDVGLDREHLLVVLHEPPLENWGIRGGRPASEVDLGFETDV